MQSTLRAKASRVMASLRAVSAVAARRRVTGSGKRASFRDFQFRGHEIPAGTRVVISALFTHRMPELWPEPDKFDPLRFTEQAVRARHKYAWVPFGGGAHMCLGLHFAYMQAKSF